VRRHKHVAILAALLGVIVAEGGPFAAVGTIVDAIEHVRGEPTKHADASPANPLGLPGMGGHATQLHATSEAAYQYRLRYERAMSEQ